MIFLMTFQNPHFCMYLISKLNHLHQISLKSSCHFLAYNENHIIFSRIITCILLFFEPLYSSLKLLLLKLSLMIGQNLMSLLKIRVNPELIHIKSLIFTCFELINFLKNKFLSKKISV